MKRLRKKYGPKIRFFHCGEYGQKYRRPHYHACIFNHDFTDRRLFKIENGVKLYTSQDLDQLWADKDGYIGFTTVGDVTFESAAYVARYITKKINGPKADLHYTNIDPETGEWDVLKPEYTTMSRRPGIGRQWLEKYSSDVYPGDFVVIRGKKMKPPKFYDRQYELTEPDQYAVVRARRITKSRLHTDDNTPARLLVREACQEARFSQLPRNLEKET